MNRKALLVLADGTWFPGEPFGAEGRSIGEVVFNTSMSGYQEILTDPSYHGQLVTMTSVHIGNYGTNELDEESDGVRVAGLVVREASRTASSHRSTRTLQEYLAASGTVAITGVDTRAVTRRIRDGGAVMGAIVHDAVASDVPEIVQRIVAETPYDRIDHVAACSVHEPGRVRLQATGDPFQPWAVVIEPLDGDWPEADRGKPLVAVVDFGVKRSILRHLALSGLRVALYPHDVTAERLLAERPAGVLLSNGPGDPARLDGPVEMVRQVLGKVPLLGICLGHQLLGRAIGGTTFKLRFGHRGPNQPVGDGAGGHVEITSQNHGYAVSLDGVAEPVESVRWNLNDRTVEAMRLPRLRAMSVQHHPEAGPGPHDAQGVFTAFRQAIG